MTITAPLGGSSPGRAQPVQWMSAAALAQAVDAVAQAYAQAGADAVALAYAAGAQAAAQAYAQAGADALHAYYVERGWLRMEAPSKTVRCTTVARDAAGLITAMFEEFVEVEP